VAAFGKLLVRSLISVEAVAVAMATAESRSSTDPPFSHAVAVIFGLAGGL
jgi:hypothetical protein